MTPLAHNIHVAAIALTLIAECQQGDSGIRGGSKAIAKEKNRIEENQADRSRDEKLEPLSELEASSDCFKYPFLRPTTSFPQI